MPISRLRREIINLREKLRRDIDDSSAYAGIYPLDRGPGRPIDSTPDWAPVFLGTLMRGTSIAKACKVAGVHETRAFKRRKDDEEFRKAWKDAADIGTDLLEAEAQRRAHHGVLKPVFYKGIKVGYERKYSDLLLIFMLKARKPEVYRDNVQTGGTINVSVQTNIAAVDVLNKVAGDDPHALISYPQEVNGSIEKDQDRG